MTDDRAVMFDVLGRPVPQGSKRALGAGRMIDDNREALHGWRDNVAASAYIARHQPDGSLLRFERGTSVAVEVVFWLPRPASAKKRRYPHVKPDLDKLVRGVFDALTFSGLIADDAQIVDLIASKCYHDALIGARICVESYE